MIGPDSITLLPKIATVQSVTAFFPPARAGHSHEPSHLGSNAFLHLRQTGIAASVAALEGGDDKWAVWISTHRRLMVTMEAVDAIAASVPVNTEVTDTLDLEQ